MSSTTDITGRGHPISAVVSSFDAKLKTLRDAPAWSMSTEETREALIELARLESKIVELQARVAAHADAVDVARESGASSTANW